MIGGGEKYRSWIPHGLDFLGPAETAALRKDTNRLREILENAGFLEVTPPLMDFAPTFQMTARDSDSGVSFETRDTDGELLAVRSDLTVQVIKALANGRLGAPLPARLSYFQPVLHDRSWGSGARREIFQAGLEIVGEDGPGRVGEMLDLARRCLTLLGVEPRILYGDVRFIETLTREAASDKKKALLVALDRKDTTRILPLALESGISKERAHILSRLPVTVGGSEAVQKLKDMCKSEEALLRLLEAAPPGVVYDYSLVRELTYYTGPVLEAYRPRTKEKILTGGIYDALYGLFTGAQKPACGFAINLTAAVAKN
ncbi:MAG: ATP phosphoribosyltransferase regulatory subunit [Spirochaetia bacterium]|nr:ATP phosphoribosyltransferase regulatory subunit [Spirochaetia bacterium]